MNYVPSTDQIMGLLRTYLPALGALMNLAVRVRAASKPAVARLLSS